MSSYDSDTEQLETLKRWWKANGRAVLAGLALGIAGVVGWSYWRSYTAMQAEQASQRYDQLMALLEAQDYAQTEHHGRRLVEDFPNSGYAGLATLVLAEAAFQASNAELAKTHLRWAIEQHADGLQTARIARLRLARLLLHEQAYGEALALLDGIDPGGFMAAYEEVKGDIRAAQGDRQNARVAYEKALAGLPPFGSNRDRVQMKLDDLGTLRYPSAQAPSADPPDDGPAQESPS
ncbi:MAG: YfgM family protein [Gammaproteobacteria bacterium]